MALFQKAPRNVEQADQYKPLDTHPSEILDYDEEQWYREVYRGDVPQLTVRAVLVGSLLGFLLAFALQWRTVVRAVAALNTLLGS